MRLCLSLLALCTFGCSDTTTTPTDGAAPDLSAARDLAAGAQDMAMVMPFNMPGMIDCYNSTPCSTSSATPVCCDSKVDGGFADNCVASANACLAMDPSAKTFACGQAADCGAGMVCCGDIGTSGSGKPFFTDSVCAASCTSNQTQMCVSDGECKTAGTHCLGQTISGRDVGLCK